MRKWAFASVAVSVLCGCAPEITSGDTALPDPAAPPRVSMSGPAEEMVVLHTRQGVTVRLFVRMPEPLPEAPKGVIVYYTGGSGRAFSFASSLPWGMAHRLVHNGFIVAVIGTPSDRPESEFRLTLDHVRDQRRVVEYLRQRWAVPVYALGHSYGAVTAAHLGAVLGPQWLGAVILTASSTPSPVGPTPCPTPASLPLRRIALPVLLVHHRNDGCRRSTFEGAAQYSRSLTASPRVSFVEVLGGNPPPSRGDPCLTGYHYFPGKTDDVADTMAKWIAGEAVSSRIGP